MWPKRRRRKGKKWQQTPGSAQQLTYGTLDILLINKQLQAERECQSVSIQLRNQSRTNCKAITSADHCILNPFSGLSSPMAPLLTPPPLHFPFPSPSVFPSFLAPFTPSQSKLRKAKGYGSHSSGLGQGLVLGLIIKDPRAFPKAPPPPSCPCNRAASLLKTPPAPRWLRLHTSPVSPHDHQLCQQEWEVGSERHLRKQTCQQHRRELWRTASQVKNRHEVTDSRPVTPQTSYRQKQNMYKN